MGIAEQDHVNRNRSIVGLMILAISLMLLIGAPVIRREWNSRQPRTGQRQPLPSLGYCATGQPLPCVVSFRLDAAGGMVVDFMTDSSVPDFHLRIRQETGLTSYQCRKDARFPTSVSCFGKTMPVGEVLQFMLISKGDDRLLSEGQFTILGLALPTPEFATTPTSNPFFEQPPR